MNLILSYIFVCTLSMYMSTEPKRPAEWIKPVHRIGVLLCSEMYADFEKDTLQGVDGWVFVEKSGRLATFRKNDEFIVVFRGTSIKEGYQTFSKDLYDDLMLAIGSAERVEIVKEGNAYIEKLLKAGIPKDRISLTGHSLGGYAALKVSDKYDINSFVFNAAAPPTHPITKGPGPKYSTNYHIVGDGISSHMGDDTSVVIRAYKKTTFFNTGWNHELKRFYEGDKTYGFWDAKRENGLFNTDKEIVDFVAGIVPGVLPDFPKGIFPETKPIPESEEDEWPPRSPTPTPIPGTPKPPPIPPGPPGPPGEGEDDWGFLLLLLPIVLHILRGFGKVKKAKDLWDRHYKDKYGEYRSRREGLKRSDFETHKIYKDALYPLRNESGGWEDSDQAKKIRKALEEQWGADGKVFTTQKIKKKDIDDMRFGGDKLREDILDWGDKTLQKHTPLSKKGRDFITGFVGTEIADKQHDWRKFRERALKILDKVDDAIGKLKGRNKLTLTEADRIFIDREKFDWREFFDNVENMPADAYKRWQKYREGIPKLEKKGEEKKPADKKRKKLKNADLAKHPDKSPIDWNDPIVDKYFK